MKIFPKGRFDSSAVVEIVGVGMPRALRFWLDGRALAEEVIRLFQWNIRILLTDEPGRLHGAAHGGAVDLSDTNGISRENENILRN